MVSMLAASRRPCVRDSPSRGTIARHFVSVRNVNGSVNRTVLKFGTVIDVVPRSPFPVPGSRSRFRFRSRFAVLVHSVPDSHPQGFLCRTGNREPGTGNLSNGIIVVSQAGEPFDHDDARPDAAPQGLSEMEPRHCRGDLHPSVCAPVPEHEQRRLGDRRDCDGQRTTHHGGRLPAAVPPAGLADSGPVPVASPRTSFGSSAWASGSFSSSCHTRRPSSKPNASASR